MTANQMDMDLGMADAQTDSALNFTRSLVARPTKLPNNPNEFEDWKFDFENYMSLIKPEFGDDLRAALVAGGPEDSVQDDGNPILRQRSVLLYAILAGLTTGKPKLILKVLRDSRNGFEAWRLIDREYQPADSGDSQFFAEQNNNYNTFIHFSWAVPTGQGLWSLGPGVRSGLW